MGRVCALQQTCMPAGCELPPTLLDVSVPPSFPHDRAASAEAGVVDARQQAEWQALRISELEQTSGAGQLMRRYDAELGRLRSAHEAELAGLRQQLAQQQHHQQQQQQPAAAAPAACSSQPAGEPAGLDSAAWAALFGEPSQQAPADTHDAAAQTDAQAAASAGTSEADADLLEAARLEIERLQELNEGLMESHAAGEEEGACMLCAAGVSAGAPCCSVSCMP